MNCSLCQSDMRVVDSRKDSGTTIRKRECLKCGYRLTTKEVVLARKAPKIPRAPKPVKTIEKQKPKAKPPKSVKVDRAVRRSGQYDDFSSNGDEDYGYIDDLKEIGFDFPNFD